MAAPTVSTDRLGLARYRYFWRACDRGVAPEDVNHRMAAIEAQADPSDDLAELYHRAADGL